MQAAAQDFTRRQLRIDGLSSAEEIDWFHDVFRRDVLKLDLAPLPAEPFAFDTSIRALPDLAVSRTYCSPMISRRRKQATSDDALFVALIMSGDAMLLYDGRETSMPAGGGTYARYDTEDADAAFGMRTGTTVLGLRLSRRLIEPLVPRYEGLQRKLMPAGSEALRLLVAYLDALESEEAIRTPEARFLVVNHIFDLVALAIGASREGTELAAGRGVRAARLAGIKKDIFDQLADPALSVSKIAARHGVTPRYIHMLFEAEGATFSEYVVGRRLAHAHRLLNDPRFAERAIGAIALEAGFNDQSYFNRTFRRRFGMTPSEARAEAARRKDR